KWSVDGRQRIGIFAIKYISKGTEVTFDYKYERSGNKMQRCYCGEPNCRGFLSSKVKTSPVRLVTTEASYEEEERVEEIISEGEDFEETDAQLVDINRRIFNIQNVFKPPPPTLCFPNTATKWRAAELYGEFPGLFKYLHKLDRESGCRLKHSTSAET
ncbi:hypothetical protein AAMO2058_000855500, partial [Amorphochlora amoebiformis]